MCTKHIVATLIAHSSFGAGSDREFEEELRESGMDNYMDVHRHDKWPIWRVTPAPQSLNSHLCVSSIEVL